jgi:hypothetical protein
MASGPSSTRRTLKVNWYEDVREQVRKLSQTPEFALVGMAERVIFPNGSTTKLKTRCAIHSSESFSTASMVCCSVRKSDSISAESWSASIVTETRVRQELTRQAVLRMSVPDHSTRDMQN